MSSSRGLGPSVRPVCGLRRAGLPRLRPPRARPGVALLRRGVQRPVRVVEVRAAERAQVGAAGQQDRVDVVVGGDGADRDRRDAGLVADAVGERRLVGAAERGPLVRRRPGRSRRRRRRRRARRTPGRSRRRPRRRCRRRTSRSPRCGRVIGRSAGQTARTASKTSSGKRSRFGQRAAVARRCGGWSAGRGTRTAGSRARSAVRAGRSRPARRAGRRATNCCRDLVQVGRSRARAGSG